LAYFIVKNPLVTVLINNHNYAEYVGAAIESALAQSYRPLEIIVVDDGSTDDSRNVLSGYGDAIVPIFKDNGGQASAFNAGFERSQGDLVRFLDADDILLPTTVETVVEAFLQHPRVGLIQCRLEVADAAGKPLGVFIPPAYVQMPTGDLRLRPADLNNGSWWSATSCISVSSTVLRRVLPLPEELYAISADLGLALASALSGPVLSLDVVGAYYRSHGRNHYNRKKIDQKRIREDVRQGLERQRYLCRFAESIGVKGYPKDPSSVLDVVFSIHRLLAVKLGAADDRLEGDTLRGVTWQGMRATVRRPDVGPFLKVLLLCWFVLVAALPRPVARRLAEKTLFQQNRRRLSQLAAKASEVLRVRKRTDHHGLVS
jgi:GT2 family glycosyltransferase